MEQLVILIIIGLISLVNWVLQKASEKREEAKLRRADRREDQRASRRNVYTQPVPTAPDQRRKSMPERDPFQDLMEALGLPPEETPPAPVTASPHHVEEDEFGSWEQQVPPPPLPKAPEPVWEAPPRPKKPDAKTARLASAFASVDEQPANYRGSKIRDLLAGKDAQRKAVVLAEILGAPRGMAPAGYNLER
jgi:hypothetical protein